MMCGSETLYFNLREGCKPNSCTKAVSILTGPLLK